MLIKKKTLLGSTLIGVVATLITGLLIGLMAIRGANNAIEEQVYNQLSITRDAKRDQVEDYIQLIADQAVTLSNTPVVRNALQSFESAFSIYAMESYAPSNGFKPSAEYYYKQTYNDVYREKNGRDSSELDTFLSKFSDNALALQYYYIYANPNELGSKDKLDSMGDGSAYDVTHQRYHATLRDFQSTFGYYDLFLVNNKGEIVYSVFKEADFATSLEKGPFADTGIAEAFRQSQTLENRQYYIDDFRAYAPSYDDPAAFIATPIFVGEQRLGSLILQFPVDRINNMMTFDQSWADAGLGDTGETFLVGADKVLRSLKRGLAENPTSYVRQLKASGVSANTVEAIQKKSTTISLLKNDDQAVVNALAGQRGVERVTNLIGKDVLAAYTPLNIQGLTWVIVAEMEVDEAFAAEYELASDIFISIAVVIVLISLAATVGGRAFSTQIITPLNQLCDTVKGLADGSNSGTSLPQRNDEIGDIFNALGDLIARLEREADAARELATSNGRIRQALDVCDASIIVADASRQIIYTNHSLNALFEATSRDIATRVANFSVDKLQGHRIEEFFEVPAEQSRQLSTLRSTSTTRLEIGERTFDVTTTPVMAENQVTGFVMQWADITTELAIENEIQALVTEASQGNLSVRLDQEGKHGFFGRLAEGLNQLLEVTESALGDIAVLLSKMAEGDLRHTIDRQYGGTFGQICADANRTTEQLTATLGQITSTTEQVATGAQEISQANYSLQSRTEEQAAALEQTSASIEELSSTVTQSHEKTEHVNEMVAEASVKAEAGETSVREVVSAMDDIRRSSNEIANIIGVIDEIAFQTNLLALNAAVEAARAGEEGRGFAVVAGEVRMLAQRSAKAAGEIKELIEDSVGKVQQGVQRVNVSGEVLAELIKNMQEVRELISQVSVASQEQYTGITQVNQAVHSLDNTTQQNAAMVEELSATSQQMASQAAEVQRAIGFFKVQ